MCLVEIIVENRYKAGVDDKKTDLHLLVNRNSDIIIIGNSRVRWHINPDSIAKRTGLKTTNIVIDGATKEELAFKVRFYLKYNQPPKFAFISTELGAQGDTSLKRKSNYLRYIYFTSPYAEDIWAFDKTLSPWDKYFPMVRYSGYFTRLFVTFKPVKVSSFVLGYQDDHRDKLSTLKFETDTINMLEVNSDINIFTDNFSAETKVVCFTPFKPSKVFYCLNENKFSYLHFNTSNFFSRDSLQYFHDGGHLNNDGSLLYSNMMANEFIKYLD
jgi:hypothetical protein